MPSTAAKESLLKCTELECKTSDISDSFVPFQFLSLSTQRCEIVADGIYANSESTIPVILPLDSASDSHQEQLYELLHFLTPSNIISPEYANPLVDSAVDNININNLIKLNPSTVNYEYTISRDHTTGLINLDDYKPSVITLLDAKNSTSLLRAPAPKEDFVRGKSTYLPYVPGGLDPSGVLVEEYNSAFDDINIQTIPPGFDRGLIFDSTDNSRNDLPFLDISNDDDILNDLLQDEISIFEEEKHKDKLRFDTQLQSPSIIDEIIPNLPDISHLTKKPKLPLQFNPEWVNVVDVNQSFDDFKDLVPELALNFPFELDIFQKQAIYRLENGESVFIAAHTSAGKTVIAEYAIALAQKHMTRAIYTSPIKALSNQKFRDFRDKFEDVGILTGDVQIKPDASCLIMTTEILRSMLYRGADVIRDVEYVIFDEVHYINDLERGVVWEEVIIMLPEHVNIILLSATVPNTKEFAEWVGRTKKRKIYVISTYKRPVPLEHYLYADKEIYKLVDWEKRYNQNGWKQAYDALNKKPAIKPDSSKGRGGSDAGRGRGRAVSKPSLSVKSASSSKNSSFTSDKSLYSNLLTLLKKRTLLPVIIFTFSKKKCEEYANSLSNIDLTSGASEKSSIHVFIEKSLQCLKGTDRELPQILRMRELLSRGIAVHHGGLLPIMKEVVEILFTRGMVKVLFATETFAMGVNAPAKCVVFSGTRKHDGKSFRDLLPGEYTQMSGRAGRRGLDSTGMVIIMCSDEVQDQSTLTQMILGKPTKLESQFRLTYSMILNLLRVQTFKVEDMIKRSFSENIAQKSLPEQQKSLEEKSIVYKNMVKVDCTICQSDIYDYYDISNTILSLGYELNEKFISSALAPKALSNGRIVIVNNSFYRNSVGVILKNSVSEKTSVGRSFLVMVLVESKTNGKTNDFVDLNPLPITALTIPNSNLLSHHIESFPYTDFVFITSESLKLDVTKIVENNDSSEISRVIYDLFKISNEMNENRLIPEFDCSKLRDLYFQEKLCERKLLINSLASFTCINCPDLNMHYGQVYNEKAIHNQITDLSHKISDQNLELLPDYNQRISILKRYKFIDDNNVVQIKGRVACEINTADELILTELIFDNFFADFDAAETVALLSCFVFQEKSNSEPILTPKLERGIDKIKYMTSRIAEIQRELGLDIVPDEAVSALKFGLVEVVYEWARGMSFKEITDLTDVLEGSIVRCIVRLDETCRETRDAARLIGDSGLYKKLSQGSELIKRDIVFAASLYF